MRGICALIVLVTLLGCASSPAILQRETARLIGGNAIPEQIEIISIDRGFDTVRWTATTKGRAYACTADDRVHRPYCFEQDR